MHIQSLTCQSQGFSQPAPLRDGVTRETLLPQKAMGVSVPGGTPLCPTPRCSVLEAQDDLGNHLKSALSLKPAPAPLSTHDLELLLLLRETLNDKSQALFN